MPTSSMQGNKGIFDIGRERKGFLEFSEIKNGLEEIRTPDPHNANVVRSQLRYKPMKESGQKICPDSMKWGQWGSNP